MGSHPHHRPRPCLPTLRLSKKPRQTLASSSKTTSLAPSDTTKASSAVKFGGRYKKELFKIAVQLKSESKSPGGTTFKGLATIRALLNQIEGPAERHELKDSMEKAFPGFLRFMEPYNGLMKDEQALWAEMRGWLQAVIRT